LNKVLATCFRKSLVDIYFAFIKLVKATFHIHFCLSRDSDWEC